MVTAMDCEGGLIFDRKLGRFSNWPKFPSCDAVLYV